MTEPPDASKTAPCDHLWRHEVQFHVRFGKQFFSGVGSGFIPAEVLRSGENVGVNWDFFPTPEKLYGLDKG